MKRKIALLLAAAMTVMTFTGCSSSTSSEDGKPKPELNIIVAHNQTSMENPYTKAAIRFKEALEEVSGGRATATLHHGTLGENESELVEKLEMGAVHLTVASPGFMTLLGVKEIEHVFPSLPDLTALTTGRQCVDGQFGQDMNRLLAGKDR